ncbi:MAG TPA: hypothetical protein VLC79_07670, partial [Cellvibrio sp.]|nr:hypothetical protein [Cellvibrio sp.]
DGKLPSALTVIQGDKDERVIADRVYEWVAQLQGSVELLRYPEAGHFFHGYLTRMKIDLAEILLRQIPTH